jgi:hypothetical protein
MTAQPHEDPRPMWVEPKIGAIRRALSGDQASVFNTELENAELADVPAAISAWHGRAVGYVNGAGERLEQARAAGYAVPAGAVRLEDLVAVRAGR